MLDSFKAFITQEKLFAQGDRILLAISGGVDSVVLVELFKKAGFPFAIAHANFGLRGHDSEDDEAFVKKLADHAGVEIFVEKFSPKEEPGSTQMAARALRYNWFYELTERHDFTAVATAHHADDAMETMLLNMVRGSGTDGLVGIRAKRPMLIRPMLFASKVEILNYARANGLKWREDRSNESLDYTRNLLRHKVLPVLRELNPSLQDTFYRNGHRMGEHSLLLAETVKDFYKRSVSVNSDITYISVADLLKISYNTIILDKILSPIHFTYTQCQHIASALPKQTRGVRFQSVSHELVLNGEQMVITPIARPGTDVAVIESDTALIETDRLSLSIKILNHEGEISCRLASEACLDGDKLEFPLLLRPWDSGDVFHPLGMKGKKKKLSDFLIDNKIALNLKSRVMVITSADQIVWVVGMRIDERFKVTSNTRKTVEIRIL